nr:hypothetical protein [Stenotrophomonas geniculata]
MSAPCKIAAIRHAVSALHGAADDGADTRRYAEALQQAGSDIDLLVEAAEAMSRVQVNRRAAANDMGKDKQMRLRAALARVKAGAA